MIKLGLDVAVAGFVSIALLLILGLWSREPQHEDRRAGIDDDEAKDVRSCPYCRHVCVDDRHDKIMVCPVCKSYFDEEAR